MVGEMEGKMERGVGEMEGKMEGVVDGERWRRWGKDGGGGEKMEDESKMEGVGGDGRGG